MSTDERLDRLEKRLAVLEGIVRQLAPLIKERAPTLAQIEPQIPQIQTLPETPIPAAAPPRPSRASPLPSPPPLLRQVDSEQWFGQRGLLGVGVIFLILAAGYLLKLSFERGWISPAARCAGGALAGVAIAAVGWKLLEKTRVYGAALIGCGAAIVYLSVWAATRLYEFFPPTTGIAGLALTSLALAGIALALDVEALGATAALGAFFAPLLLASDPTRANALLLYLGCIGVALGWVAANRKWRLAMLIVALSFFGLVTTGASSYANPYWVLVYGLVGGCGGLYVGLREGWFETRVLAFLGGWGLLRLANDPMAEHWPTVVGAAILAGPVWWRALRSSRIWPSPATDSAAAAYGESLYFYLTPLLVGWAIYQLSPASFDRNPGLVSLIVSGPYLVMGFSAERRPFALVGTTAVLAAAMLQWRGIEAAWALLLLGLLWTATDHILNRTDGRWYGLVAAGVGLAHLLTTVETARPAADSAFLGGFALTLWWAAAEFAGFALGLWRRMEDDEEVVQKNIPSIFWITTGLLLLFGVTKELSRAFAQSGLARVTAHLASGLAVSAWWIVFAAALVLLGFRRGLRTVRVAGLLVAGMAVVKVVLFDLSTLDALYRVGSVLILGVVSLGLAYIYNKRAASPHPTPSP